MTNHFLTSYSDLIWLVFVVFMQLTGDILNGSNPLFPENKSIIDIQLSVKIHKKLKLFYVAIKLQAQTQLVVAFKSLSSTDFGLNNILMWA